MKKQLYFVSGMLAGVIMIIITYAISANAIGAFSNFEREVQKQVSDVGRPEIVFQTNTFIVAIFDLKESMKEFRYNKITKTYKISIIPKLEDSTKSLFHKEPYERLKEAIEMYEK